SAVHRLRAAPRPGHERVYSGSKNAFSFSRLDLARVVQSRCPCPKRGRRESGALTAPVDPVRRSTRASHVRSTWARTTGTAETSRLSPRNGFTTYFVLSPVSGVCCHRCHASTGRHE